MATPVFDASIEKIYGDTLALSTTAQYLRFPHEYQRADLFCTGDFKLLLNPLIQSVLYYDASADSYTDYTDYSRDGDSSTHVPLDAMATTDILYLGFEDPVAGLYFDMGSNVNSNSATLDVEYYNGSWTDVSGDSDGTASGGATLAKDGAYTWTLPTDWVTYTVSSVRELYWIRFKPSAQLSATVDVNEILTINQNTKYGYRFGNMLYSITINNQKVGALQVLAVQGTPTLYYEWQKA